MCFSAIVSFSAASGLLLLGIGTLIRIRSKREVLLGSFPCFFALQQALEGLVWSSHNNNSLGWLNEIGVYGFLLFATFLWLFLSPLSIYLLEEKIQNKRFLLVLAGAGVIFGIYLFGWIIYHGVEPQTFSGNLFYDLKFIPFYEMSKYLYLMIITLPFLIAQRLSLKLFGGLIIGSFVISQLFFQVTLVSVWCFFAAILSGVLYFIIFNRA